MITASKLTRAGFTPGEWKGLEDGGRYRDWELTISHKLKIVVCQEQINGKEAFTVDLDGIFSSVNLDIDSVSKLLELKKLLK